ncbi:hypothetical protein F5Y07DRAFT_396342 [Xylaria sp. FL0933]|nr:hypothetical protein F5Y07DRAFT_396342 [Xylaria sp. FL0933]
MACPTSTPAHEQLEGVPNAPPDSATPRRYSHLLTHSPATFRDLPTELRWIVWDAMIDQTALLWSYRVPLKASESQKLSAAKHYENRVVPFLILSQLNRGSRSWVLKRFQLLTIRPCWESGRLHYSPICIHLFGGPMRCVFSIKVDALRISSIHIQEKVYRHQLLDNYLFPSWPTIIENIVTSIALLENFLDFSVHELPSLKKIYLDMTRFGPSPPSPDGSPDFPLTPEIPLPQFLLRRNDSELVDQIAVPRSTIYRRTPVWIDEVEGAKRIGQIMAIPSWSKPMSALWPALERHRCTCVFIFNATGEFHVFSASRRPEALEQEDYSEEQE